MKLLLVVPSAATMAGLNVVPTFPHLGIGYLAAMLREDNEVRIVDMRVNRSRRGLIKLIRSYKPESIGITSTSFQRKSLYKLISDIKKEGDHKIILGGPHISAFKRKALEESIADLAVIGEGEYALKDICSGKPYDSIDGLIWRKNGDIIENKAREYNDSLDRLPFPAFELFDLTAYTDKKIPILTSRGCPHNCVYCSISLSMGRRFRSRSPENVIDEISYWHDKGYRLFQFQDDCFSFDMNRAKKICELILKKSLNIKWDIRNGLRVEKVDKELLALMKRAGCIFIAYGIESVDEEVLRKIKKGSNLSQIKNAMLITKEIGIDMGGFFIVGLPGDTSEKAMKGFDFAKEFNLKEYWFYNAIPYPGTELYEWIQENAKWLAPRKDYLENIHYFNTIPAYETEEFRKKDRIKVLKALQKKAMRRIIRNEFGLLLGLAGYFIWRISFLNNTLAKLVSIIWKIKRKNRAIVE